MDIVIAGAGAVGSTCAYVLARAGHRVTVVDPGPLGANASGVAAGMLAPAFETLFEAGSREDFARLLRARNMWPPLADAIGLPLRRDGAMGVGSEAQTAQWAAGLADLGVTVQQLAPEPAALRAPLLAPGLWAVLCDADCRLDPIAALAALWRAAEAAGARLADGRVLGFSTGAVRVDTGAQIPTDCLVIATGASKSLTPVAPELAILTPVKGHILRARPPSGYAREAALTARAPGVYVCADEAQVLLGASMETGADDAVVDPAVVGVLKARGAAIAPALAELQWQASTGVRAATPDGWPLAGFGQAPGVVLAVGARRNGWLLAPLIAEVVLATLEARAPGEAGRRFDPARLSRG